MAKQKDRVRLLSQLLSRALLSIAGSLWLRRSMVTSPTYHACWPESWEGYVFFTFAAAPQKYITIDKTPLLYDRCQMLNRCIRLV